MADRFSGSDTHLDEVLRRLEDLDRRMHSLEAQVIVPAVPPSSAPRPTPFIVAREHFSPLTVASLAGRTSLVLGGGYLLRALTSSHVLPIPVGVGLGLAYAILWIVMADRAGQARKDASAAFHALASAAVACPLLYEAMMRFRVLDAWTLTANLTVIVALGIAVGWSRWLQPIVWIFSVAAIATVLVLMRAAGDSAPLALHLVVLAALTYWIAYARPWWRIRWLAAIVVDGVVLKLVVDAMSAAPPLQAPLVALVGLSLFGATIGSVAWRTLALDGAVTPFDVAQSAAAVVVGYGGAAFAARAGGLTVWPFAAVAIGLGALAYAIAFSRTTAAALKNFQYFAWLAIALVIVGGVLLFRPFTSAALWIALALTATWLGKRSANVTLSAHGTTYLFAATVASGLLLESGRGVVGGVIPPPQDITPMALVALLAAAACSAMSPFGVRTFGSAMASIAGRRPYARMPRAVALALLVLGLAGVVIVWLVPELARTAAGSIQWGLVATIRTTVLALAVVLLAGLARGGRVLEAGWLVYPLLVVTGLKILVEDLRQSEPAMLFVALVVYGSVLIVAPRLSSPGQAG